jgi:protein required for attachment to host cells
MYWIILADTALYRIYNYERKTKQLSLVAEKYHPESRAKAGELTASRYGHYKTRNKGGGAYESPLDPKEEEVNRFLKTLSEIIDAGRINNQYEKFILIAPPKTTGIIKAHFNKNTASLMLKNIQKDYMHLSEGEFKKFLYEQGLIKL